MKANGMTAGRSTNWARAARRALRNAGTVSAALMRPTLAAFLAALLVAGPVLAQDQPQQQQPAPAPQKPGLPPPQTQPQDAYPPAPTNPPIPVSLGISKYNYRHAPKAFPNLIAPYRSIRIPEPVLTNSPRVDQLIHDGKLELTLQDAVELALENSMDIAVARYNPWFGDTDILQTEAGGQPFGITGAAVRQSFANVPFLNYDPTFTSQISYDDRTTPINNPFISGTGTTATAAPLASHTATYSNNVTEGFSTGTTATVAWNNTRSSSGSAFNFFNPDVSSELVVTLQQQFLKKPISKNPLAANLINVEIIPTDKPTPPETTEAASFEESIKEAFQKRPELLEQQINITNAEIDARATGIALRPTAALFAQYTSQGLAGVSTIPGTAGAPPTITHEGFTTSQSQLFQNKFPDYLVGVNVQIPIRNRSAQATNQRTILQLRQIETQMQQLKNAAVVDVRNTYIALEQGRVQVATASEARKLQQQTFDAEQKKYQLGASTVYLVILTQRDLVTAQGAELRALANLLEAKAAYKRAVGRTLEVNRVTIADAKHGEVDKDTLIPGTLHGKVVGTEDPLSLLTDGNSHK